MTTADTTFEEDAAWEAMQVEAPRTEQIEVQYVVRGNNGGRFVKHFERLAKTCAKHGQVLTLSAPYTVTEPHPFFPGETVERDAYKVSLPPLAGQKGTVVGHFERAEDGVQFYTSAFREENLEAVRAFHPRAGECDHCGKARLRNQTFVVRTEEGDRLVAKTCLFDYMGLDPKSVLAYAAAYEQLSGDGEYDEDRPQGGRGKDFYPVERAILLSYRVARKLGGYSKDKSRLHFNLVDHGKPFNGASDYERREQQAILDSYEGFDPPCDMEALRDYVNGVFGDFGDKLRLAFSFKEVEVKRLSLIVAGVGLSVGRVLKLAKEAEEKASLPPAKHFDAAEGARIDFTGRVVRTYVIDGAYGPTCIVTIRCDDGSVLVNFHTGKDRPEADRTYSIRATIKRHGTSKRDGTPETTLSRAVYTPIDAKQGVLV